MESPGRIVSARAADVNRASTDEGERARASIRGDTTEQIERSARGSGNHRSAATGHDGDHTVYGVITRDGGDVTVVLNRRGRVAAETGHREVIGHGDATGELNLRTPSARIETGGHRPCAEAGAAGDFNHPTIRRRACIQRHATREGVVAAEDEEAGTGLSDAEGTGDRTRHREDATPDCERARSRERRGQVCTKVKGRRSTEGQVIVQRIRTRRRQRDRRSREVIDPTSTRLGEVTDAEGVRAFQREATAVSDFSATSEGVVTRQAEHVRRTSQRQLARTRDNAEETEVIGSRVDRDDIT